MNVCAYFTIINHPEVILLNKGKLFAMNFASNSTLDVQVDISSDFRPLKKFMFCGHTIEEFLHFGKFSDSSRALTFRRLLVQIRALNSLTFRQIHLTVAWNLLIS